MYLGVARRWWWTMLSATVAAALSGYVAVNTVPPTYEAQTRVLVGPANAELDTLRASALIVETYAELVRSEDALRAVIADAGMVLTPVELGESVDAVANTTTRLLTIEVALTDPSAAAAIADALAQYLIDELGPSVTPAGRVRVVDAASVPTEPISPNIPLLTALSAAAGFLASLVLVILMERFSSTVNSGYELTELSGAPYFGTVLYRDRFRPSRAEPLVVESRPDSEASLTTRLLSGKITLASEERPQVIALTASEAGDGTGELAANIAAVLSRAMSEVILVDGDDTDGEVTRLMTDPEGEGDGLWNLLRNIPKSALTGAVDAALVRHGPSLSVLPRGKPPFGLVDRDGAKRIITELRRRADMIVISAGPAHRSASAIVWANLADVTVLVARRDATRRGNIRSAIEALSVTGSQLDGVAMLERRWRPFSGDRERQKRSRRAVVQAKPADLHEAQPERRP